MDFSYHYTTEQEDFRERVSGWLDENAPADADALFDSADGGAALGELTRKLGGMGWLAPAESAEHGGAALSPDLSVVLLEELNRRGLLRLIQNETQAFRTAIHVWGTGEREAALSQSLAGGERAVWRHLVSLSPRAEGGPALDPDSVGLTAEPDSDGYIINGVGLFSGLGDAPAILWTVALVESDAPDLLPVCLLIDANSEGVTFAPSRTVSASAPRPVRFEDVWALRTDALGPEGEGHRVISAEVSLDPNADLPSWIETETGALLDYARSAESEGAPLSENPIHARILVEAYIASRVSRLLRMRAGWLESEGERATEADALASLWRRAAASELTDTARQVVGPRALLSADDPQSADAGRFDRLSRRELAERQPGNPDREALSDELELGKPKE